MFLSLKNLRVQNVYCITYMHVLTIYAYIMYILLILKGGGGGGGSGLSLWKKVFRAKGWWGRPEHVPTF